MTNETLIYEYEYENHNGLPPLASWISGHTLAMSLLFSYLLAGATESLKP